jgi:hypothetical protein
MTCEEEEYEFTTILRGIPLRFGKSRGSKIAQLPGQAAAFGDGVAYVEGDARPKRNRHRNVAAAVPDDRGTAKRPPLFFEITSSSQPTTATTCPATWSRAAGRRP